MPENEDFRLENGAKSARDTHFTIFFSFFSEQATVFREKQKAFSMFCYNNKNIYKFHANKIKKKKNLENA